MAENQYKRKTAERVAEYANDDPLAELARVVGYDPRKGGGSNEPRAFDSGIDLEAELLRELHGTQEDELRKAQDFAGPAGWRHRAAACACGTIEELFADGGDDVSDDHEQLSEEIGLSLEDELMRELQGEYGEVAEMPEAVAADDRSAADRLPTRARRRSTRFRRARISRSSRSRSKWSALRGGPIRRSARSRWPAKRRRSSPAITGILRTPRWWTMPGGFAFPSDDELEEDEQFSANRWDWKPAAADGRPESVVPRQRSASRRQTARRHSRRLCRTLRILSPRRFRRGRSGPGCFRFPGRGREDDRALSPTEPGAALRDEEAPAPDFGREAGADAAGLPLPKASGADDEAWQVAEDASLEAGSRLLARRNTRRSRHCVPCGRGRARGGL